MKSLLMMAVLIAVAYVAGASVEQKTSAFVLCKHKKDVRTIRVVNDGSRAENCTISYTKGGVEEIVGSNRSISSCKSILKNIQTNLEGSNWSCRNVLSANVMTSSEVIKQ